MNLRLRPRVKNVRENRQNRGGIDFAFLNGGRKD